MSSKQRKCCGDRYVTGIVAQCICRCLSDGLGDSGCYYYVAFCTNPFLSVQLKHNCLQCSSLAQIYCGRSIGKHSLFFVTFVLHYINVLFSSMHPSTARLHATTRPLGAGVAWFEGLWGGERGRVTSHGATNTSTMTRGEQIVLRPCRANVLRHGRQTENARTRTKCKS
jgi:hypothetical protein